MKSVLSIILFFLLALQSGTATAGTSEDVLKGYSSYQIATIDSGDTVFFDLTNVIVTGNQIQVPVMFNSDDPVYAFDFSFRYNEIKLTYDTIITAAGGAGILAFSYKNPLDSIVRFTSSSLVTLLPLTPIVYIVFTIQSGQSINSSDFNTVKGYLNGDACSEFFISPVPAGYNEVTDEIRVSVYPNPATTAFSISTPKPFSFEVLDVNGRLMVPAGTTTQAAALVDCSGFPTGQYLIRLTDMDGTIVQRRIQVTR